MKETLHDHISGEITLNYLVRRAAQGWKIASVEWERALDSDDAQSKLDAPLRRNEQQSAPPYGLQVASAGAYLEENSAETSVLVTILEQIVKEKQITEIARVLNAEGYLTREGTSWNPTAVFNLLPRLVEAAPTLFKSQAWEQRRTHDVTKPN